MSFLLDVVLVVLIASQVQSSTPNGIHRQPVGVKNKTNVTTVSRVDCKEGMKCRTPSAERSKSSVQSIQGDQPLVQYCYCNKFATVGMQCNPATPYEDCKCLPNFTGGRCERCMPGFYNFPNCLPCKCNAEGSDNLVCDKKTGRCPCRVRIRGMKCDLCPLSHYGFPQCKACLCSNYGSYSYLCEDKTGQCKCKPGVYGRKCDECPPGYYNFPLCWWCGCNMKTTKKDVCTDNGKCVCKDNYQGAKCNECKTGYYSYPQCTVCDCKSGFGKCGKSGECICFKGFTGRNCDKCAKGYYGFPSCTECDCNPRGSHSSQTCHHITGKCQCKINVVGKKCDSCAKRLVGFPECKACTCNSIGTRPRPGGGITCFGVEDMRCLCKKRVEGKTCDRCRYGFYNFNAKNPAACSACACSNRGSLPEVRGCNFASGTCSCRAYVTGAKCDTCINGTYGLMLRDFFGCQDCKCNPGGSVHGVCDKKSGQCKCHPGVGGSSCDRIKPSSKIYFPTLHHIKAELEDAVGGDGIPVLAGSNFSAFPSFSGTGYVVPPIYMPFSVDIQVPVSGSYQVIVNYAFNEPVDTSMDVTLTPKGSPYPTHRISDIFRRTDFRGSPRARLVAFKENGKNTEVKLTKGTWTVSFTCKSTLILIDYVVLLPEDYYTGSVLKHTPVEPCKAFAGYNNFCSMFKYFSTKNSQRIYHGIHGFIDSGLPVIKYIEPKLSIKRLDFGNSATLLGKYQPNIYYEIQVNNAGLYILMVKYIQPSRQIYRIKVKHDKDRGKVAFLPCAYRFACRQVITSIESGPMKFKFKGNLFRNKVTLIAPTKANIGIISITVFEESKWNISHVTPFFHCFFHQHKCVKTLFSTPRESSTLVRHTSRGYGDRQGVLNGVIEEKGKYHIVIHYKLTSYIESRGKIHVFPDLRQLTIDVTLPYCPAVDGCRSKVNIDKALSFRKGVASVMVEFAREVQIDNVILVPESALSLDILKPHPGNIIESFLKKCSKRDFYTNPNQRQQLICTSAIFTMTLSIVGSPPKCNCNPRGSRSLKCKALGGQCMCKRYVVGRRCDRCPIGYSGFPQCRKCSCFAKGSASQDCDINGKCQCKPGFGGYKCNRCESSFYYGFPQCKKCVCNDQGSLSMMCSQRSGQCQCRMNFGGVKCDRCRAGYFDFPSCKQCNCNPVGMLILPGQENTCGNANDQSCTCKANVQGDQCQECKDLFFGLSAFNPAGCQSCQCNSNGTLGSISTCNKDSGDCVCKQHVTGRVCSSCEPGYFNLEQWKTFGCTKCTCNPGGSFGTFCDDQTGQCICLPGIEGRMCDKVIPHNFYYADLHHIKIELEDSTNENGKPAIVRDDVRSFPGFTWKGYTELSIYQTRIYMTTNIPRTTRYRLIFHYSLNDRNPVDALLRFEPTSESGYLPDGRPKPIEVGVRFKPTATWRGSNPQLLTVVNNKNLPIEVLLSQGKWKLSLAARPSYFYLDHLVLLPENYYNPTVLGKEVNEHCQTGSSGYCRQYKLPSMSDFVSIETEKSLFTGPKVSFVQPPFKGVTLNGYQNVLTMQLPRDHPVGTYIVVTTFYYEDYPYIGRMDITWHSDRQTHRGWFSIFTCRYTNACRQVAIDNDKQVTSFKVSGNSVTTITLSTLLTVAVDSITVIPKDKWKQGYLLPAPYCVKLGQSCLESTFTIPPRGVVIQAENTTSSIKNGHGSPKPPFILNPNIQLEYIKTGQRTIYINARATSGSYFILVHFFQPNSLSFTGNIIVSHSGFAVASRVDFRHCPRVIGCRSAGTSTTRTKSKNRIFINIETELLVTVTIPKDKSVWIDYILLVPTQSFLPSLLQEDPVNMTSEFMTKCAKNHFLVKPTAQKLCLDYVFTLTTRFNRGGIPCECDQSGSINIYCKSYGGQCRCKPNVIGRTCNTCKAGYSGFPNCRRR